MQRTLGWASLTGVLRALHKLLSKRAIAFEIPFAAHRLVAGREGLSMQHHPLPAPRRARAGAGIVLGEAAGEVIGPADISEIAITRGAAEHIDDVRLARAGRVVVWQRSAHAYR
jgi:hypothetical protein